MRTAVINGGDPLADDRLEFIEEEERIIFRLSPREKMSGPLYPGSACSRSSRRVRKNRSTGPLSRPVRSRAGWIEIPIRRQTLDRWSET